MAYRYLQRERQELYRAVDRPDFRSSLEGIVRSADPDVALSLTKSEAVPARVAQGMASTVRQNMRTVDYEEKTLRQCLRNVQNRHGELLILSRHTGVVSGCTVRSALGAPVTPPPAEFENVLAFCAFRLIEEGGVKALYIWEVHCTEENSGRGYGSAILEILRVICRSALPSVREIALTCSKKNERALKFYKRHGFVVSPDSPEGEGYWILHLPLREATGRAGEGREPPGGEK